MPKVIKPSNPFTNVCFGFCFNNIFAATNFGLSTVFRPIPNEEMMGDEPFGATAAGLFWTVKRLLSTSCNKQGHAVASNTFFHGVIPDAFWSSQNRMCRKLNKP